MTCIDLCQGAKSDVQDVACSVRDSLTDESATQPITENERELTELEKYWKPVKDNPSDFTGWTYLLQYVEQEVGWMNPWHEIGRAHV